MKDSKTKTSKMGMLVGLLILIIGILSVMLVKLKPQPPEEEVFLRPVKTYEIGDLESVSSWKFTANVRPAEEVDLSFEVNGTVAELLVVKGETVTNNQVLARLDQRDYKNNLAAAAARYKRAEAYLERMTEAHAKRAVSEQEFTDAQAQFEVAKSELAIAEKALDDTILRARFGGTVADTYIDQYQNVRAKENILTLHDVSSIDVVANVAEKRVIFASENEKDNYRYTAVFDLIPDKEFDLKIKEFSTEADPQTQTYSVTFNMPKPEKVNLLGGMSTTVYEYRTASRDEKYAGYLAPLSAVPVDSKGNYYVWKIRNVQGEYQAERTDVKVGTMSGDKILILDGVEKDELIAAAGVHFLREGQQVRLMK